MKSSILASLKTKLVLSIFLGAGAAVLTANLIYLASQRLNTKPFFYDILSALSRGIGIQNTINIAIAILFILFIVLLANRSLRYLKDIVHVIGRIESGDLDARAEVRSRDELGMLALSVNNMAENLKKSIQEEKKAELAKKELISSVSHDLRTPLTSIIGFLGLLMDRKKHPEQELERFSRIAYKKSLRLKELIDDLFEYTRVSYSGIRINKISLNLKDLVYQLIEDFYPVVEESGMTLHYTSCEEKVVIFADGELLARLFENLLANAVRYGSDGKIIDVCLSVTAYQARVEVKNFGKPIPDDKIPHLFDRFYRVDESRSQETGGSGLGLAIAKSIVDLHNGTIEAQSREDWTSFTVTLPLGKGEHA